MLLTMRRGVVCNAKLRHRLLSNTVTATGSDQRYVNIRNAPEGFDTTSAGV
jgi:hypothetical protein